MPDFQVHAIVNHPNSKDFFERYGDKFWQEHSEDVSDQIEDIENEPLNVSINDLYLKIVQ